MMVDRVIGLWGLFCVVALVGSATWVTGDISTMVTDHAGVAVLKTIVLTAQGVVAGANMILVDFHPEPKKALVDGPQALLLEELSYFLEDVAIARDAYEKRRALAQRQVGRKN